MLSSLLLIYFELNSLTRKTLLKSATPNRSRSLRNMPRLQLSDLDNISKIQYHIDSTASLKEKLLYTIRSKTYEVVNRITDGRAPAETTEHEWHEMWAAETETAAENCHQAYQDWEASGAPGVPALAVHARWNYQRKWVFANWELLKPDGTLFKAGADYPKCSTYHLLWQGPKPSDYEANTSDGCLCISSIPPPPVYGPDPPPDARFSESRSTIVDKKPGGGGHERDATDGSLS